MIIDGDKLKVWNAPIARRKLGSATGEDVTLLEIALALETAARIAADAALSGDIAALQAEDVITQAAITALQAADVVLQNQITALQQPIYSTSLLLGGM